MIQTNNKYLEEKNLEIIHSFYLKKQTFVTKEELINAGFDFSQFFSTSTMRHYFDVEENSFEYKDFNCGVYFIKTRDKNLERPEQSARLFFQIIKVHYDRIEAELKFAVKLLKERKFAAGHSWAYSFDSEMRNEKLANSSREDLKRVHEQIARFTPNLENLISSIDCTKNALMDLRDRLNSNDTDDDNWI